MSDRTYNGISAATIARALALAEGPREPGSQAELFALGTVAALVMPAMQARIAELESALAHYPDATTVQSYGYEEDMDIGGPARKALGLPEPTPHELAKRCNTKCYCEACRAEHAEWLARRSE